LVIVDIVLTRHGEKEFPDQNGFELNLSLRGFKQAEALGKRLQGFDISAIHASDMVRARQTADTANKFLKLPIEYYPGLREINMGIFQNGLKGNRELEKKYNAFFSNPGRQKSDIAYPEGENGAAAWDRIRPVFMKIIDSGQNCLVVAHGGTIRIILCGLFGIGFEKRFLFGSPVCNCGITILRYNNHNKTFAIQLFNDAEHIRGI
jgi:broad specificity phosphatase PhoE